MTLVIENKTPMYQLIWVSSVDHLDEEEVILLRGREKKCLHDIQTLEDVTIWDRSPEFRLCHRDCQRMRQHFAISYIAG